MTLTWRKMTGSCCSQSNSQRNEDFTPPAMFIAGYGGKWKNLDDCLCAYKTAEFYIDFKHLDIFLNKKTPERFRNPVKITGCSHIR